MAYSESLAARIRDALARTKGVSEKKMFGSVVFLLHGNLLVGVWQSSLIARVGPEGYDNALSQPHVKLFDVTGKPMRGWVMVESDGLDSDAELTAWIDRAHEFVATLPKK